MLHPAKGEQRDVAPPWRLSDTPAVIDQWTPDLGENNLDVFRGILGLGEAEVERLQEAKSSGSRLQELTIPSANRREPILRGLL